MAVVNISRKDVMQVYRDVEVTPGSRLNLILGPNGKVLSHIPLGVDTFTVSTQHVEGIGRHLSLRLSRALGLQSC